MLCGIQRVRHKEALDEGTNHSHTPVGPCHFACLIPASGNHRAERLPLVQSMSLLCTCCVPGSGDRLGKKGATCSATSAIYFSGTVRS